MTYKFEQEISECYVQQATIYTLKFKTQSEILYSFQLR